MKENKKIFGVSIKSWNGGVNPLFWGVKSMLPNFLKISDVLKVWQQPHI